MPKISIIIPVYNADKFLIKCLDSVCSQSFKDIQIICVNDCSTDSSGFILDKYSKRDSRILVVNNETNLGAGLSRNVGMNFAEGEYIHYVDSDDWMERHAYEILVSNIKDYPDVVTFLWKEINARNKITRSEKFKYHFKDTSFSKEPKIIEDFGLCVWNRIYRREFLLKNNILFGKYRCLEDVEYSYKVAIKAKNVRFIEDCLLNYRTHNQNSVSSKSNASYDCIIKTYDNIYEYTKGLPAQQRDAVLSNLLNSVLYHLLGSLSAGYLTLSELKTIVNNFDYDTFLNDKTSYKWFGMYNEILHSNTFMIKVRYNLKSILKNNLYPIYEFLKEAKKR